VEESLSFSELKGDLTEMANKPNLIDIFFSSYKDPNLVQVSQLFRSEA